MGVFHNPESALPVSSASKAVEEVGKSVFMQCSGYEKTDCKRRYYCYLDRKYLAYTPETYRHDTAREPSAETPIADYMFETFVRYAFDFPERQTGIFQNGRRVKNIKAARI